MTDTLQTPVAEDQASQTPTSSVHSMTKQQLVDTLREIVEKENVNAHKEVVAIKQAMFAIRQRELNDQLNAFVEAGNDPAAFVSEPDPLENEAKELQAAFREKRAAHLAAEEARMVENLKKKEEIVEQIKALTEDIDNINLHFQKFQELQQAFKSAGNVPPQSETDIWKRYQGVVEQFYDCLNMNKELRALDFKKNLEIKTAIIEQTKALAELEDIAESGRRLQQMHNDWRETGPVAKELRDDLWEQFRAASTVVGKRIQEYFDARKAAEKGNEEAKTALCEELEAIDITPLKSFAAWDEAQNKIKDIQSRWKEIGHASRKADNDLYARFRKKCDEFFAAKAEFARNLREELQKNLEHKTRLCEQAEALKDKENLKEALDAVVRLQAEWKTIGPVGRKHSDEIWQRFMNACNYFFDERKKQQSSRRAEENENLEKKRAIVAKLREIPVDVDRKEGLQQVKALQKEWQEAGHVPFKQKDKLYAEYREVCDTLYEAFNESRTRERRRNFEDQIGNIKGDENKLGRERDRLLRIIDQRRQELKTYENNLGFFNVKSSSGNSMVKEMERKMQRLKDEIGELQEKVNMLDKA